jgi:hypothetical protein
MRKSASSSCSSYSSSNLAVPIEFELQYFQGGRLSEASAIRLCICDCIGTWMMQCWRIQTAIPLDGACLPASEGPMIADSHYVLLRREGKDRSCAW